MLGRDARWGEMHAGERCTLGRDARLREIQVREDAHKEDRHAHKEGKHARKRDVPYKHARRMSVFRMHVYILAVHTVAVGQTDPRRPARHRTCVDDIKKALREVDPAGVEARWPGFRQLRLENYITDPSMCDTLQRCPFLQRSISNASVLIARQKTTTNGRRAVDFEHDHWDHPEESYISYDTFRNHQMP